MRTLKGLGAALHERIPMPAVKMSCGACLTFVTDVWSGERTMENIEDWTYWSELNIQAKCIARPPEDKPMVWTCR